MIKNEEDVKNCVLGSVVSTVFLGLGFGVILGVMAVQDIGYPNWVMVVGLIFAMLSFVVFYALIEKVRKAGYKLKAVKKVEE